MVFDSMVVEKWSPDRVGNKREKVNEAYIRLMIHQTFKKLSRDGVDVSDFLSYDVDGDFNVHVSFLQDYSSVDTALDIKVLKEVVSGLSAQGLIGLVQSVSVNLYSWKNDEISMGVIYG